jgi:predicted transposase YdaD
LIYQIEENLKSMERDNAIRKAIAVCIENKILTDFLKNNYEEAIKVMTYTYNEEFARQALIEEGEARGEARGVAIGEARGVALGEARGEVIKAKAIALVMMADGENINKIVRYTGLNEEEVNRIYSEFIIPTINAPN